MEEDVEKFSAEIVRIVTLIINPTTSVEDRMAAHSKLDVFKDTSPLCAKCGFYLSAKNNLPFIRHCGFQLIDHYIKLNWNKIDLEEKLWIKNSILQTIATGTEPVIKEEVYVKDAVSRIVVELIKREWPQQWPSLMEELHNLCCMGDEQTELVLLVFSRLADDIVQFQNVPDKRRREIYKTLCSHLNDLFAFFWKTLSEKTEKYFESKQLGLGHEEVLKHCRVAQVTLETLSTFVEWVPINHIIENSPLLKLLSKLLEVEDLRMHAVICLQYLFERKGKPEERKELLIFFEETIIFSVISALDVYDEHHYLFLKVLLQCFYMLCVNLTISMVQFSVPEPENFSLFLNSTLLFTKHPSLVLSQIAHSIWLNVLRSAQLSSSSLIHTVVPTLLKHEAAKLLKLGYPSKNDSLSCKFSLADYDSDEEFETSFFRLRGEILETLRLITKSHPRTSFTFLSSLLKCLLSGQDWSGIIDCSNSCINLHMCWEAVVCYIDAVCITLWKNIHTPEVEELKNDGLQLLELCINFNCEDPVILSYELSCISSLFFFITFCPELRVAVIDKIFSNLTCFKLDCPGGKNILNLRRHSSSLLIKLSMNHPLLLLPEFSNMCSRIQNLFPMNEYLTQFDKCALLEALMILSNKFYDYEKQSSFLKIALSSIEHIWFSPVIKSAIVSPDAFIPFIGIDKPFQKVDGNLINKDALELMLAVNVVKSCVKRCVCPKDPEVAKKGNFIHPLSESYGSVYYRNPSAQYVIPMLENVFQIIRTLNTLHDPVYQQKFNPDFFNVLDISDVDKNSILGVSFVENPKHQKTPCDRINCLLHGLHDGCLHILGGAVENIYIDLYTLPDLPSLLKGNILYKIEYMPPMKLRNLFRIFLGSFFLCCPSRAYDELMVVLAGLCPFMLQKLTTAWEKFKLRFGRSTGYEEQLSEVQEILDDQLNRLLTREYLSFLGDLLCKQITCSLNEETMEDDQKEPSSNQSKTLSPLGLKIMQTESVRTVLICTAFDSLRFLDTVSNLKAVQLCDILFSKMIEDGLVQQILEANYLLQSVLYGLQELGEHETNLGLMLSFGLTVYESLRHRFPEICHTLMNSVDCDEPSIRRLEDVLLKNAQKTKNDKQKKEAFKAVIGKIIGKNIGQHHKREVVIKNLSPLIYFKAKDSSSLLDVEVNDDIGICNLFAPPVKTG